MAKIIMLFVIVTVIVLFSVILAITILKNLFAKVSRLVDMDDRMELKKVRKYKEEEFVPSKINFF